MHKPHFFLYDRANVCMQKRVVELVQHNFDRAFLMFVYEQPKHLGVEVWNEVLDFLWVRLLLNLFDKCLRKREHCYAELIQAKWIFTRI